MLEKMQRQRARAVKKVHVTFLRLVEIAVADIIDKAVEQPADAGGKLFPGQCFFQFLAAELQLCGRIGKQQRNDFQGLVHYTCSRKISVGVWTTFWRLEPNRSSVDVPPEQPLPKVKPQEPRTS